MTTTTPSTSNGSELYDAALTRSNGFESVPEIRTDPWNHDDGKDFGGDIKIVENKLDPSISDTEAELPTYLRDRYVSLFVSSDVTISNEATEHLKIIANGDFTEYRSTALLFPDMWTAIKTIYKAIEASNHNVFEVRAAINTSQSLLEPIILKQILAQEYNEAIDVLINVAQTGCFVRFFTRAFGSDLKKFMKRVRSVFELSELASRVHEVALKYNPGPFSSFEQHEFAPRGFNKDVDDE